VFTRGQVVDANVFPEPTRLLAVNAIRSAQPHECELESVNLDAPTAPSGQNLAEMQLKLDDKQAVIEQLQREVQSLRSINQSVAASTDAAKVNELAAKLAETDVVIKSLQNQLAEAKKENEALKAGK
jgi:predicted RNase H-like nuclease (RuvC/YqgF family)